MLTSKFVKMVGVVRAYLRTLGEEHPDTHLAMRDLIFCSTDGVRPRDAPEGSLQGMHFLVRRVVHPVWSPHYPRAVIFPRRR